MKKSILLLGAICIFALAQAQISEKEYVALKAMYDQMGGAGWKTAKGWDFSKPASTVSSYNKNDSTGWFGLTVRKGHVTAIKLSNNNLKGSIPVEFYDLEALQMVNLAKNAITGSISPKITNLRQLTFIDLGSNQLTGNIPAEIAGIGVDNNGTKAQTESAKGTEFKILLSRNQLSGEIPAALVNMPLWSKPNAGIQIDLSSNKLTGKVPLGLDKIPNLLVLKLEKNLLEGDIPQISQ